MQMCDMASRAWQHMLFSRKFDQASTLHFGTRWLLSASGLLTLSSTSGSSSEMSRSLLLRKFKRVAVDPNRCTAAPGHHACIETQVHDKVLSQEHLQHLGCSATIISLIDLRLCML